MEEKRNNWERLAAIAVIVLGVLMHENILTLAGVAYLIASI